jgi:phosphatidylglycerol---prolipoprotein diacylglyceryl transferase
MKKILTIGGGIVAVALGSWAMLQVFSGDWVLPQSFSVGPVEVRYYGLIMAVALLAAHSVARANSWRFGLSKQETDRVAFWAVIAAVVSARLYFILFDINYFLENPSEIFKIWNGGISIYGAIFGGALFLLGWTRKRIYSDNQIFDLAALALPLGQAIGRFGNFFNYEAYGNPTSLPWKMFVPEEFRVAESAYYHPAFLYEAIASLAIFAILMRMRGKVRSGNIAASYLMLYSVARFCIETLRVDSVFIGSFRADQLTSLMVFLLGLGLLVANKKAAARRL